MGHDTAVFVDGISSGDIVQGELGDCWFLGAASVVATREDLLYPLVLSAHPEYGFYQFKIYKNAKWRYITIDDFVPLKFGQIRFGKCADPSEIWVPLLEKAFAKLNGNYENCASGNFGEGMTDLTGEGCESFDLTKVEKEDFWSKLAYFHEEAFLMGCSKQGGREELQDNGLLTGHAYAILSVVVTSTKERLLHIRNPWGQKEWNGAWSDKSSKWTPQLKKELNHLDEDDGAFYMEYSDFLRQFSEFCVCRLLQDEIGTVWEKRIFADSWGPGNAGGCGNTANWKKNDQFWIENTVPGNRVFFHLAQEDVRSQYKPQIEYSIGLYLMKSESKMVKKDRRTRDETLHTPTFINRREYAFSLELDVGLYVVMPCTFDPDQHAAYFLTVYSENALEAGRMGKGTAPKEHVEPFLMDNISWLSAPGVMQKQSGSEALKSPRRAGGGISPRRGRPVSPRRSPRRGRLSPRPTPSSSGSAIPGGATRDDDEMLLQAMGNMSSVVDGVETKLESCKREYDEKVFDAAAAKLKFVFSKFNSFNKKCATRKEQNELEQLDSKIKKCEGIIREIKMAESKFGFCF
jgi:hypothetical protein